MRATLVLALLVATGASGEIYKCPDADGKIEYKDRPCPQGAKVVVPQNSVSEVDQSKLKAKSEALDRSIKAHIAADDSARERQLADVRRKHDRCQEYADEGRRQRAWYSSISAAVRQSAYAQNQILERKYNEDNCDRYMP